MAGQVGAEVVNGINLRTTKDTPQSARHHYDKLEQGLYDRVQEIAPGAPEPTIATKEYVPGPKDPLGPAAQMTEAVYKNGNKAYGISINPNADAAYYAHELGHIAGRQTKIGGLVHQAKHTMSKNPRLGRALAYSLAFAVPAVGAALQEGDDDLAGTLALSAAMASPTLVDEALATKNGLAIMEKAGTRATLGQRGRLAGGYLSYLAPVLLAGSAGHAVGSAVDDHTALYNL